MADPRIILVAGPTASGKSAFAMALAEQLGGVVINADSMQVYRELRVLTARPTTEEEARVPHKLFGHVSAAAGYSVGEWRAAAQREIDDAMSAGRSAIVVGGTGLYFKALTEGLAPMPDIPAAIREFWRGEAARVPVGALYEMLRVRDPETAAKLLPSDPQRIVRALEVFEATGKPLAAYQVEHAKMPPPVLRNAARLVMAPDRAWLWQRIAERSSAMLAGGGIDEVVRLKTLRLPTDLPAMRAIGVAEICALIDGRSSLAEVESLIVQATRRYAKRQQTWIRGQMADWRRFDPSLACTGSLVQQVLADQVARSD
jgi:tRNA dimethylallyltransferase